MLPVYELKDEFCRAIGTDCRLIIEAPTGSGKSTQVPQMLLDSGQLEGGILVLQPRRLAARLLARRVAQERNVPCGGEVGYQVRFENQVSAETRITYVTEGILLRRLLSDPELNGVSAVIFDEFHERHLYGDISLARLTHLQRTVRPDLLLLVMSATLDAGPLRDFLSPCRELKSEGRTYPVEVAYLSGNAAHFKPWEQAAFAFEQAVRDGAEGDFLVFMPGAYEIGRTVQEIRASRYSSGFAVLPLHGELSPQDQDAAVASGGGRKVVVATNIAETSITIEGVRNVIDSGLARIARYDPVRGIDTLLIERISRASADQRAGRAGRTAPGRCLRLWSERDHQARPVQEIPEIHRQDLAECLLMLKAGGMADMREFPWFEAPKPESLERAELLLHDLGATRGDGSITETGLRMLAFPVHPRYARLLLAAEECGCVRQACLIAAIMQGRGLLVRQTDRAVDARRGDLFGEADGSDFNYAMRAWSYARQNRYDLQACRKLGIHAGAARQVDALFNRFLAIAEREGLTVNSAPPEPEQLRKAVFAAFSDHLARRMDKGTLRCDLVHGRRADLARESAVRDASLLVAAEIREIGNSAGQVNTLLTMATEVEESWLQEFYPDDFEETERVFFNVSRKRVMSERSRSFRGLVLESMVSPEADEIAAAEMLARRILDGELNLPNWNQKVEEWIQRLNCLAQWCPELQLPVIDEERKLALLEEICLGAFSVKDLKDRAVFPVVKSVIQPAQRDMLDKQMPERIELPSGMKAKVRYAEDAPPVLSATIQKLYGLEQNPKIAFGKITVAVEALAPNQRPQQITSDMRRFWQESYPMIRKELRGRYPKHEWR